jgi:hypothetical protein
MRRNISLQTRYIFRRIKIELAARKINRVNGRTRLLQQRASALVSLQLQQRRK